jgi:predicted phosphodiesterase
MHILAVSDIHSPSTLDRLLQWVKENPYDFGFALGDFGTAHKASEDVAMSLAVRTLPKTLPRVYVLYGNHDDLDAVQSHPLWLQNGLHNIHGFKVFAVNGIWGRNPHKPWHQRVTPQIRRAEKAGPVDILVTHEHPFGLEFHHHSGGYKFSEKSWWHKQFADAVANCLKPRIWLYGHSYTKDPDRTIPDLNIRTLGIDSRFVMLNENFKIVKMSNTIEEE